MKNKLLPDCHHGITCEDCKEQTPSWYELCYTKELQDELKKKGFNTHCVFDVIHAEVKKRIEDQFNNMVTFEDLDKQFKK